LHGTGRVDNNVYLRSSSIMITVALPTAPTEQSPGNDDWLIVTVNVSFPSNILSTVIGILTVTLVSPAGIVTVNGPTL